LAQLEGTPSALYQPPAIELDSPAAIIFTTGSTGPPKGVLYTHRTFNGQVDQIQTHYGIQPGGVDLSGFPLFGLFNAVMGTTTVIPDMDPTRPADVDPPLIDPVAPDTATTGIPSSGIEVLGRSHTGHEFVARVLSEMPDVAVGPLDDERLFGALVNGASSAVLLDEPPELAGSVVIGTARGESRILPRMAFRLLHDIDAWARRSADPLYPPPQLTATEREVLGRLGDGDDPATIATLHHVTAHLVNIHTGYAVAKLHRYVLGADRAPTGG